MLKKYFSEEERLQHKREFYQKNKERLRKLQKERYQRDKEKLKAIRDTKKDEARNNHLVNRYGIGNTEYNEVFLRQRGVCAICFKPETVKHQSGIQHQLCVDHCHNTNKIRGLLCRRCNLAIGYLKDDPILTENATKYLLRNNRVYWIIGQMCSGKTHYSHIFGDMLNLTPFHLDHIRNDIPLVEAYKEAITSGLIEGFTPHRNQAHLEAITQALDGKEVFYILIEPTYEQWLENCKPVIECPTDENPPNYTKEEYEAENRRLRELHPRIVVV